MGKLLGQNYDKANGLTGRHRKRSSVHLEILCGWILLLLLQCHADAAQPTEIPVDLQVRKESYEVDKHTRYNINDDRYDDNSLIQKSQMLFHAKNDQGRLCVFQRHLDFRNYKVQLYLRDGRPSAKMKVVSHSSDLLTAEWCTSGPWLTVEVNKRDEEATYGDVALDLLVYQFANQHRKAYMDTSPSCSATTFEMNHSQVIVTNLNPTMMAISPLYECDLKFEYRGVESNRYLCMVFEPSTSYNLDCGFNYTLTVLEYLTADGANTELSLEEGCDRHLPRRWCSNSTKIALKLHRQMGDNEKGVMFHALVLDHDGGPDTLPSAIMAHAGADTHSKPSLYITVLSFLLILIVFATLK